MGFPEPAGNPVSFVRANDWGGFNRPLTSWQGDHHPGLPRTQFPSR